MRAVIPPFARTVRRFRREERGVALVEFAISLPLILALFAVIVESGRMFWAYQSVSTAVRDTSRYLGRLAPANLCETRGAGAFSDYNTELGAVFDAAISPGSLSAGGVTATLQTPVLDCVAGDFRVSPAPVAELSATLTIDLPFTAVFVLLGLSATPQIATTISDRSRIFGT